MDRMLTCTLCQGRMHLFDGEKIVTCPACDGLGIPKQKDQSNDK